MAHFNFADAMNARHHDKAKADAFMNRFWVWLIQDIEDERKEQQKKGNI